MRDELLNQHTELGWFFACAEKVMLQESTSYKEKKRAWANETGTDADAKQWEQFVSIAESGRHVSPGDTLGDRNNHAPSRGILGRLHVTRCVVS
jgi:hypothetical protein